MEDDEFGRLKDIQEVAQRGVEKDNKQDTEIEIRMMVLDLTKSNRPIQTEEILTQGELRHIKSDRVRSVIDKLVDEGVLKYPQEGYVQRNMH